MKDEDEDEDEDEDKDDNKMKMRCLIKYSTPTNQLVLCNERQQT